MITTGKFIRHMWVNSIMKKQRRGLNSVCSGIHYIFHFSIAIVLISKSDYTPNGYIVPAEFGVHFLPRMKNIQKKKKKKKLHLNEIGLTNIEFCKRQI